ncbi:MAG: hypothetical protein KJN87_12885 [Desulfofustis sp.]|nr:hypothetical protein [Desulfofustis sp.]
MKQMQDMSVTTDFTITGPGRIENVVANRLLGQYKKRFHQLWNDRRELLIAVAATCTISLSVLLISYLFFVQLAAHGW